MVSLFCQRRLKFKTFISYKRREIVIMLFYWFIVTYNWWTHYKSGIQLNSLSFRHHSSLVHHFRVLSCSADRYCFPLLHHTEYENSFHQGDCFVCNCSCATTVYSLITSTWVAWHSKRRCQPEFSCLPFPVVWVNVFLCVGCAQVCLLSYPSAQENQEQT